MLIDHRKCETPPVWAGGRAQALPLKLALAIDISVWTYWASTAWCSCKLLWCSLVSDTKDCFLCGTSEHALGAVRQP
jgi:hypothetical protein